MTIHRNFTPPSKTDADVRRALVAVVRREQPDLASRRLPPECPVGALINGRRRRQGHRIPRGELASTNGRFAQPARRRLRTELLLSSARSLHVGWRGPRARHRGAGSWPSPKTQRAPARCCVDRGDRPAISQCRLQPIRSGASRYTTSPAWIMRKKGQKIPHTGFGSRAGGRNADDRAATPRPWFYADHHRADRSSPPHGALRGTLRPYRLAAMPSRRPIHSVCVSPAGHLRRLVVYATS